MKSVFALAAAVVVGILIYLFIAGPSNSIKAETTRIFDSTITDMQTVKP